MNIVEKISKDQIDKVVESRPIPEFGPGDTLKVHVKVVEGTRERVQIFEGVCIARKADSINSNFTVRKISYGEGGGKGFSSIFPKDRSDRSCSTGQSTSSQIILFERTQR